MSSDNGSQRTLEKDKVANPYLIAGVLTSIGASVCCIGPFILLATGISGAWMSQLMILQPYQPVFVVIVLGLFAVAGWNLFQPSKVVAAADSCVIHPLKLRQKVVFFLSFGLAAILLSSEYWIPVIAS